MQLSPSESFCADTQLIFLHFFLGRGPHSSMVYKSILPPTGSELCGPGGQDFPRRSYGLPRPSALSVQTPVVDMAGLGPGAQLASPGGPPAVLPLATAVPAPRTQPVENAGLLSVCGNLIMEMI